jgi:hypothetical protein
MLICPVPVNSFVGSQETFQSIAFGDPSYAEVSFESPGGHQRLAQELGQLFAECQASGWDGHGAAAVNHQAYVAAWRFIQSLPYGFPDPTLAADPEGCVTFEWYVSPRKLVLVSVHPDYRIDYATMIGDARSHGTEPFFNVLPDKVVELVRRICKV